VSYRASLACLPAHRLPVFLWAFIAAAADTYTAADSLQALPIAGKHGGHFETGG